MESPLNITYQTLHGLSLSAPAPNARKGSGFGVIIWRVTVLRDLRHPNVTGESRSRRTVTLQKTSTRPAKRRVQAADAFRLRNPRERHRGLSQPYTCRSIPKYGREPFQRAQRSGASKRQMRFACGTIGSVIGVFPNPIPVGQYPRIGASHFNAPSEAARPSGRCVSLAKPSGASLGSFPTLYL